MHYAPHIDLAFLSIEHICRDVNYVGYYGIHMPGASMFFIVVYSHVACEYTTVLLYIQDKLFGLSE